MRTTFTFIVLLSLLGCTTDEKSNLVLGYDMSATFPLHNNQKYASRIALKSKQLILEKTEGSRIRAKTFGQYSNVKEQWLLDITTNRYNRLLSVAKQVEEGILNLPKIENPDPQEDTALFAFIEESAKLIECDKYAGEITIFSDGDDDEGRSLLQREDALPPVNFKANNCSLTIYGVGHSINAPDGKATSGRTQEISNYISEWAKKAQFKTVNLLPDF